MTPNKTVEAIIDAEWIIPVIPENQILERHSLIMHEGRILDLLPISEVDAQYHTEERITLPHQVLIPGLINTHTHAAMSLFRGLADDLPLMDWLQNHIWPAEAKWVNTDFVRDGTQLAIAEMIASGTTCFNDMYFFPDDTARVADAAKMRATVGLILIDFPTIWANDADEYIHKGIEVHDQFRNNPLISTAFAPHAPYTVSDEPLKKVATLAEELDIPINIHLHETAFEVQQAMEQNDKRPIQRLQELGLLSPRLLAVHMTQLVDADIEMMAQANAHVVHCPESNLKLASGFCPVDQLLKAGINVALGTDGAASNNDLDMLGEMRTAALLAKAVSGDASAVPAAKALSMATINGAKALGLDKDIGSLEIGKAADVVAIDLDEISTQPMYNPLSQLVYASTRDHINHVWIAGHQVYNAGQHTTIDLPEILNKTRVWGEKIRQADENPA